MGSIVGRARGSHQQSWRVQRGTRHVQGGATGQHHDGAGPRGRRVALGTNPDRPGVPGPAAGLGSPGWPAREPTDPRFEALEGESDLSSLGSPSWGRAGTQLGHGCPEAAHSWCMEGSPPRHFQWSPENKGRCAVTPRSARSAQSAPSAPSARSAQSAQSFGSSDELGSENPLECRPSILCYQLQVAGPRG